MKGPAQGKEERCDCGQPCELRAGYIQVLTMILVFPYFVVLELSEQDFIF